MMNELLNSLRTWNSSTSERQKLQHCYIAIIVCVIVISGFVSMISALHAHKLAVIALIAIGVYLANALVWNLLNSAILMKIEKPKKKNNR